MECWTHSALSCVHSSKQLFLPPWMLSSLPWSSMHRFIAQAGSRIPFRVNAVLTAPARAHTVSCGPAPAARVHTVSCGPAPVARAHTVSCGPAPVFPRTSLMGSLSAQPPPCSGFLACVFSGPMKAWALEDRHYPWFTSESSPMTIDPGTLGVSNF